MIRLPARFFITILRFRFSSLNKNLPKRTKLFPTMVMTLMIQLEYLNIGLKSSWFTEDIPKKELEIIKNLNII